LRELSQLGAKPASVPFWC